MEGNDDPLQHTFFGALVSVTVTSRSHNTYGHDTRKTKRSHTYPFRGHIFWQSFLKDDFAPPIWNPGIGPNKPSVSFLCIVCRNYPNTEPLIEQSYALQINVSAFTLGIHNPGAYEGVESYPSKTEVATFVFEHTCRANFCWLFVHIGYCSILVRD